jgi:quinol monooxygenase YgiN
MLSLLRPQGGDRVGMVESIAFERTSESGGGLPRVGGRARSLPRRLDGPGRSRSSGADARRTIPARIVQTSPLSIQTCSTRRGKWANTISKEVSVVSRVNFLQTEPDRIGDVARAVREIVHPGIRDEAGYVGYIVLGDRETGRALGVTLWENEDAREASDTKARHIRPRLEQETGGTMRAVERFDVLFFDVGSH